VERSSWIRRAWNSAYVAGLSRVERGLPYGAPEELERRQRRRLRSIVRHAYESVPFYREAMDERGLRPADFESARDLAKLPLIDAATVQLNIDRFTSSRYDEDSRETFHSSGSESHVRRRLYWDRRHLLRAMACADRDRAVVATLASEGRVRTAVRELVGGSRVSGALGRLVGDPAEHRRLSIFLDGAINLRMRALWSEHTLIPARAAHHHFLGPELPLPAVVERMNEIRPRIVFSLGSYADHFFRYLSETGVSVALPRVWVYTSDHMSARTRELAEREFGCAVYSLYSTTEAHRLGIQCERRRGHHLNVDLYPVRIVDEDGANTEPGGAGEVVVSNLHNRAMVLLNYRLGDIGVLDPEPCPCGMSLPLLAQLEGRPCELLRLSDGREIPSLAFERMFEAELRAALKVQLEQRDGGPILWRIVAFEGADRDVLRAGLLDRAEAILGARASISVEFVDDIPRGPGGKFPRVVR
jgi:phenylacetate-coenzyme A ligase PaaK-like adenylate-forming protein